MVRRCLLLAGSHGPERIPARPDPQEADWHLPLHLRDEGAARERIAAQVAAGADVVVAPTWLTHRRALLPLGETRRAAAWSAAAVRLAREAVELGLERREEHAATASEEALVPARPSPLVAATLPALDDDPQPGSGRLLPPEAASVRDYRDQAGILADAEPDLILVEGQRSEAGARLALAQSSETGVRTWAALTGVALASAGLHDWLDWASGIGIDRLLVPAAMADRQALTEGPLAWGVQLRPSEPAAGPIEAGAGTLALLDGAASANLAPLRATIDEHERAALEIVQAHALRWMEHVRRAALMAGGGHAAWVGPPPTAPLPSRFEWLVLDEREARHLPLEHYRLVVVAGTDMTGLGPALEPGGLLAVRASALVDTAGLRLVHLDENGDPALAVYRREHG
jgi:hypothetical protein